MCRLSEKFRNLKGAQKSHLWIHLERHWTLFSQRGKAHYSSGEITSSQHFMVNEKMYAFYTSIIPFFSDPFSYLHSILLSILK